MIFIRTYPYFTAFNAAERQKAQCPPEVIVKIELDSAGSRGNRRVGVVYWSEQLQGK
jgi:hypothetical protein